MGHRLSPTGAKQGGPPAGHPVQDHRATDVSVGAATPSSGTPPHSSLGSHLILQHHREASIDGKLKPGEGTSPSQGRPAEKWQERHSNWALWSVQGPYHGAGEGSPGFVFQLRGIT